MPRNYKVRSIDIWDEEAQPILTGVVVKFEEVEVDNEMRSTMLIDTGESIVRVWHSHALTEAFDLATPTDGIRIAFKGYAPLKGKKTFKRISVQVWEGGDLEEIVKEAKGDTGPISA